TTPTPHKIRVNTGVGDTRHHSQHAHEHPCPTPPAPDIRHSPLRADPAQRVQFMQGKRAQHRGTHHDNPGDPNNNHDSPSSHSHNARRTLASSE
ncbi:MAG: hypothetical protein AAFS10_12950, partial [Myxococcota bacterium]